MAMLATWCPSGGVLAIVAPLALAAAAGDALVVDLDPGGPHYPGPSSLADLVEHGPRRADLEPQRRGVAVLRNGGVRPNAARQVIRGLITGWPNVVFRVGAGTAEFPTVPVIPLFPGELTTRWHQAAVYQDLGWRRAAPGPGLTLPRPSRATITALLEGRRPARSRWVKAWGRVWGEPWE